MQGNGKAIQAKPRLGKGNEREGNAGLPIAVHRARIAHDATGRIHTDIPGACEFTGNQRIARRIRRWQNHCEGRQYCMPSQRRLKALIRPCGCGENNDGTEEKIAQLNHVQTP